MRIYNYIWAKTFGGYDWEMIYAIEQSRDGRLILAGYTMSFGAGDRDMYLLKLDADFNAPRQPTPGIE